MLKRARAKPITNFLMFGSGLAALGLGLFLLKNPKEDVVVGPPKPPSSARPPKPPSPARPPKPPSPARPPKTPSPDRPPKPPSPARPPKTPSPVLLEKNIPEEEESGKEAVEIEKAEQKVEIAEDKVDAAEEKVASLKHLLRAKIAGKRKRPLTGKQKEDIAKKLQAAEKQQQEAQNKLAAAEQKLQEAKKQNIPKLTLAEAHRKAVEHLEQMARKKLAEGKYAALSPVSESSELDEDIEEEMFKRKNEAEAIYAEYQEKEFAWDGYEVSGVSMDPTDAPLKDFRAITVDFGVQRERADWNKLKRSIRYSPLIVLVILKNVPEKLNDEQYDFIVWFLLELVTSDTRYTPEAFTIRYPRQFDVDDDMDIIVKAVEMQQTMWEGLTEKPEAPPNLYPPDVAPDDIHLEEATQQLYKSFQAQYAPSKQLVALYEYVQESEAS